MKYHVTYFYLATGMEGRADEQDYGVVRAPDPETAKRLAATREHPTLDVATLKWVMGCLTAKPLKE